MSAKWKSLSEFIEAHRIEKGCEYTHTNLGHIPFSFYIPFDNLEVFYSLYEQAYSKQSNLYLTEKNRHFGPIVIDFDFKFNAEELERKYTSAHVEKFCEIYGKIVKEYFNTSDNDYIYVMEKKLPNNNSKAYQKDGIHFVIPTINTNASIKELIRRDALVELEPIFQDMGTINNAKDIVDEAVIERNSWYMYGSKKRNSEPYLVTHVYDMNGKKVTVNMSDGELIRLFSLRNKTRETKPKDSKLADIQVYEKNKENERKKIKANKKILQSSKTYHEPHCENIEYVEKIIDILDISSANNYEDWIRLGWCLRNIDNRLEAKWEEFSKRSAKYEPGACGKIWNRMKEGGLGIGTLYMWAKHDSPEEFEKLRKTDIGSAIYESRSKTHYDIARVVYKMYHDKFVCASPKGRIWYEFKDHRWHICESGITLRQKFSEEVWRKYQLESSSYSIKAAHASLKEDADKYSETAATFQHISMKLRDGTFKENIMKECMELFYVNKFEEKLDANTNLIAFENGVYDIDEHEFRDGKPEDYISFSTGVNYHPYDPTSSAAHAINNYLSQVLTSRRVRDYVLKLFSTFITGQVKEQKFYLWTGSGSNSKSKLVELFEKSFGDYCCKFPVTLLTQKRIASNAANSELARAKGKRFACLQEPSEDERINIGLMKELSGGDKIMARALYREPFEFFPQFKMLLLCNHLPYVPSDDGGTWRRIRVVEFTSKFVENPQEPNEFPIDYDLSEKMEEWREQFIAMMIHYYKLYEVEGITEPPEVLKCTTEYREQNDHMAAFISSKLEKKEGSFMSVDEVHTELKAWIKDDCIPLKLFSKPELKKYLTKTLGKTIKFGNIDGFNGYRLKTFDTTNVDEDE